MYQTWASSSQSAFTVMVVVIVSLSLGYPNPKYGYQVASLAPHRTCSSRPRRPDHEDRSGITSRIRCRGPGPGSDFTGGPASAARDRNGHQQRRDSRNGAEDRGGAGERSANPGGEHQ